MTVLWVLYHTSDEVAIPAASTSASTIITAAARPPPGPTLRREGPSKDLGRRLGPEADLSTRTNH